MEFEFIFVNIYKQFVRKKDCKQCELDRYEKFISYGRKRNRENKIKLIIEMGGKCACCGITQWWVLELDHKKSVKKYNLKREQSSILISKLLKNKKLREEYQWLCSGCNMSKMAKGKCILPHWFVPPTIIAPKVAEIF